MTNLVNRPKDYHKETDHQTQEHVYHQYGFMKSSRQVMLSLNVWSGQVISDGCGIGAVSVYNGIVCVKTCFT